jgi:hypothetical protein
LDNGRKKCWAVLVIEDEIIERILSERDYAQKLF